MRQVTRKHRGHQAMTSKGMIGAICVVVVIGGLMVIAAELGWFGSRAAGGAAEDFIEEDNGQVIKVPAGCVPPVLTPDGKALVRGVYYSWDNCQTKKLVYLEKYTPEVQELLKAGKGPVDPHNGPDRLEGLLVRLPEAGAPWLSAKSAEGKQLMEQAVRQGDTEGRPCFR